MKGGFGESLQWVGLMWLISEVVVLQEEYRVKAQQSRETWETFDLNF